MRGSPVACAIDSSVTWNSSDPTLAVCPSNPKVNCRETASLCPCKLVKKECHLALINSSLQAEKLGVANNCPYSVGSWRLSIVDSRKMRDRSHTMSTQLIRRKLKTSSILLPLVEMKTGNSPLKKHNNKGWQWQWRTCKENHGRLRHVLPTLQCIIMIWTRFNEPKTSRHL